jgi:hypothetical protein
VNHKQTLAGCREKKEREANKKNKKGKKIVGS